MNLAARHLDFRILFSPCSNKKIQIRFTAKGMENQRYLEHKNNTTNTACMKSIGNVTLQVYEFWRALAERNLARIPRGFGG